MRKNFTKHFLPFLFAVLALVLFPIQAFAATALPSPATNLSATYDGTNVTSATASTGTASITVKGGDVLSKNGKLTLTNSGTETAILSFDYAVTGTSSEFKIAGSTAATTGSYSAELSSEGTVEVYIKVNRKANATVTLTNIQLKVLAGADVTVTYGSLGSVTVGGNAVSSGSIVSVPAAGSSFVATPNTGASFLGWITDDNKVISTDATYTLKATENMNVEAVFCTVSNAYFYVGSTTAHQQNYSLLNLDKFTYYTVSNYSYLFDNLNAAASAAANSNSKYIVLANNGTLPAGNYTIPSGVTLLIPFDSANTVYTDKAQWVDYSKPTAYRSLTMADGVNLTVNGSMCIAGKHFAVSENQTQGGSPSGPQGYVNMLGDSTITIGNGGCLYTYGYIYGSGTVTANSGSKVYEIFQVTDFRGATNSLTTMDKEKRILPFSQYYIQNIEVELRVNYGATAYLLMNMNGMNNYFPSVMNFIGTGESMFNILDENSYFVKRYDGATDRLKFDMYGTASFYQTSLSAMGMTLDTKDYVFPLNSNIDVRIHENSSLMVKNDICFLPGSTIRIDTGAKITIDSGKQIYVYDSDQWGGYVHNNNYKLVPVSYGVTKTYTRTESDLVDTKIIVNGILDGSAGAVYSTTGGANISSDGAGKAILPEVADSVTYQAQWNSSSENYSYPEIPVTSLKLTNGDGSKVETANGGANTYTYTDGFWRCTTHTPGAAATCNTAQICTVCQEVLQAALGHTEVIVPAVAPTCTATGLTEGKKCSVCGTVTVAQTEVGALGHEYGEVGYEWTGYTACVASHTCGHTGCGVTETANATITNAVTTEPTCTESGVRTYTATFTETWAVTQTKTETIAATGHNYTGAYKDNGNGTHSQLCLNGCNTYGTEVEHTYDQEIASEAFFKSEANCQSAAVYNKSCACGAKGSETFENGEKNSSKHTQEPQWATDADGHRQYYPCCNADSVAQAAHSYVNGECTVAGCGYKCTHEGEALTYTDNSDGTHKVTYAVCGAVQNESASHNWGEWFTVTEPNCVTPGSKTATCTDCGATGTDQIPVDGTAHNWAADWSVTEDGKNHYRACTNTGCNAQDDLGEHEDADAKDHFCDTCNYEMSTCADGDSDHLCDYCGEPVSTCTDAGNLSKTEQVNATCAATGTKEYWTCYVCAKNYSDAEAKNEITDLAAWKADENGGLIPATGEHTYSEKYTTENGRHWLACTNPDCSAKTNDAECTDGEDNDHNCDTCGAENVSAHIYAFVNNYDGTHDYTCSVCGDVQTANAEHVYGKTHECACGAVAMFTITFNTDGGSTVAPITGNYGTAVQVPEAPTKDGYTFAGWDTEIPSNIPAENMTITAQWTINTYTVNWENEDGTVLETDENVAYGATPKYDRETPTKAATAQYTYTFSGWTPEVSAVTGDVTYKATYTKTTNTYTVTWKNENGTVLETDENVLFGATPNYDGKTPTKEEKGCTSYTFMGWDQEPASVIGDATYTAVFKETTEHSFTQKVPDNQYKVTDATCTKKATYYYSCVCGVKGTETFEHGKLQEHDWNPVISYVAEPKKDEHGCEYYEFKASRNCVNCNATEETTAETIGDPVPYENKESTCKIQGVGSRTVTFVEDWTEPHEFQNLMLPLDPNNHADIQTVEGTAPTCTATGKTDKIYCNVCGTVLVEQKDIDKIPHGIKEVVYAGGNIPVKNQNIAALKASSFIQEMTVQDLMDKVNYCVNEAAKNSLLGTFANFYGSVEFQNFVQEIVGKDAKDLTDTQKSNATVLYVAQKLSKATAEELRDFLATNTKYDTISRNEDMGEKIAQAALTYGMYCAYESCGMEWKTVNLDEIANCIQDSDGEGFLHYLEIQGERDLAGFLAAMETIHDAVEANKGVNALKSDAEEFMDTLLGNDSENKAVETLLEKGFSDPDLVELIQNEITDYSHTCSCGAVVTKCEDYLIHRMGKLPTCTETGLEEASECMLCGATTGGEEIPMAAHNLNRVEEIPAGCETEGTAAHWKCETCEGLFADEKGTQPITAEVLKIPAAHVPVAHEAKDATCSKDGNIAYWTCGTCDKFFSNEECTTETTLEAVTLKATGDHNWDEGEVTTAPTCKEEGIKTYTCANCGETKTDSVDKVDHTPGEVVVENEVASTTTAIGSYDEVVYCSVEGCGHEISRVKKEALLNPFGNTGMELNTSLGLSFNIHPDTLTGGGYTAVITKTDANGNVETIRIEQSDWINHTKGRKRVVFENIAAKQMTDPIQIAIYKGDERVSVIFETNVRQHAMAEINAALSAGAYNYVTMYVDMLNYGAAAQDEFSDYRINDLANNQLGDELQTYATKDVSAENRLVAGTGYSTTALNLENKILLNLIFFESIIGKDTNGLYAKITYTHHSGDTELYEMIDGAKFIPHTKQRKIVQVDLLDVPDGNELVKCEIIDKNSGEVIAYAEDTINGYLMRGIEATGADLYYTALKFTTSAYAVFHTS